MHAVVGRLLAAGVDSWEAQQIATRGLQTVLEDFGDAADQRVLTAQHESEQDDQAGPLADQCGPATFALVLGGSILLAPLLDLGEDAGGVDHFGGAADDAIVQATAARPSLGMGGSGQTQDVGEGALDALDIAATGHGRAACKEARMVART